MKKNQSLLLVIAFVCALSGSVYAQETQPEQTSAPPPSPGMDIQGIKKYLLGPGDVVDVRVFGQPDLSSIASVDGEGRSVRQPLGRTEKTAVEEVDHVTSRAASNRAESARTHWAW